MCIVAAVKSSEMIHQPAPQARSTVQALVASVGKSAAEHVLFGDSNRLLNMYASFLLELRIWYSC
jgi:hypothetical protein